MGQRGRIFRSPAVLSIAHIPAFILIRSFSLRDSWCLHRLARRSTPLQIEQHLVRHRSPLWTAVSAPLPWHGAGAATFMHLGGADAQGFVQALKRPRRAEADILCMAPAPGQSKHQDAIGLALLTHLIAHAGGHGIQRLFLCLPSDDPALAIAQQSGFVAYIQETLFQLPAATPAAPPAGGIRRQRQEDSFALQRLHNTYTPPLVQQAEGTLVRSDDAATPLDLHFWWQPEHSRGYVYEGQEGIAAAAFVRQGRNGHWLRLLGGAAALDAVDQLLARCLYDLIQAAPQPIYCALRPYQSSFGPLLRQHGFTPGPSLTRLVKHTTSFVKQPAPVPARELIEVTTSPFGI